MKTALKNRFLVYMPILLLFAGLPFSGFANQKYSKFSSNLETKSYAKNDAVSLTKEEQKWIDEHPVVRLGTAQDYPPFDFTDDNGRYIGITPDYLRLITKYTGLQFEVSIDRPWSETYGAAIERDLDGMACIFKSEERETHFYFTDSYFNSPEVIIALKNNKDIHSFGDLFDKIIAVEKNYLIEEKLIEKYPEVKRYQVANPPEALYAVSMGKADAYIGNFALASHYIEENQLANLQVVGRSPFEIEKFRIAIRNDWSNDSVSIINKGIQAITFQEHQAIKHKWLGIRLEASVNERSSKADRSDNEPPTYMRLLVYVALIFVGCLLLFVLGRFTISYLFRKFAGRDYQLSLRYVLMVGGTLFATAVLLTGWLGLKNMEQTLRENVGESLIVVARSTNESLRVWYEARKEALVVHAQDKRLLPCVKTLLELPHTCEMLNENKAQTEFRENYLRLHQSGTEGMFLIAPDRLTISTMNPNAVGSSNFLARYAPKLIDRAFNGETVFIPPIKSGSDSDNLWNIRPPQAPHLYLATPVRDEKGNILAVLVHNINLFKDFSSIFHAGRISESGETYAFNANGFLLTASRFSRELKEWGLVEKEDRYGGVLSLRIAAPPVNLTEGPAPDVPQRNFPLTKMAQIAISGKDGVDVEGYEDYRGVRVLGAWIWDDVLGIGLATEIDEKEALKAFTSTRIVVVTVVSITVLLSLLLVGVVLWVGEHGRRTLETAKNEWENLAETRTRELRQREKKFSAIFDQTTQLMSVLDTEGNVLEVNRAAMEMTKNNLEDMLGRPFWKASWWDHSEDLREKIKHSVKRTALGEFVRFELTLPTPMGEKASIDFTLTPVMDENNEVLFLLPMGHDITERIKAERAITASEKRSRSLLESAPDAMIIVNRDGVIEGANKQAETLFRYTREEILWQPIERLVPENIREKHVGIRSKYISNPFRLSMGGGREFFTQTKDGEIVPVEISLNPLETDEGTLIVASIRDITERKKLMLAIESAEERSRLLLESVGEGIVGVNSEGVVSFVNPAAMRMLGYSQPEIIGKSVHSLIHHSTMTGEPYPQVDCPMTASYRDGKVHMINDEVLWRKDGTWFPVEYSSMPIEKDGKVIGAVVAFKDITESKRVEKELHQHMDDLERFNKLAVGREEMMITLKEEINNLYEQLGKPVKYRIIQDLGEDESHV